MNRFTQPKKRKAEYLIDNGSSCSHSIVVELFTMLTGCKKYCLLLKINHTYRLTKLIIILVRAQTPSCQVFLLKSLASQLVPQVKQQLNTLEISHLLSQSMIH